MSDKVCELSCRLAVEALDADSHEFERILRAALKPLLDAAEKALSRGSTDRDRLRAELQNWTARTK